MELTRASDKVLQRLMGSAALKQLPLWHTNAYVQASCIAGNLTLDVIELKDTHKVAWCLVILAVCNDAKRGVDAAARGAFLKPHQQSPTTATIELTDGSFTAVTLRADLGCIPIRRATRQRLIHQNSILWLAVCDNLTQGLCGELPCARNGKHQMQAQEGVEMTLEFVSSLTGPS